MAGSEAGRRPPPHASLQESAAAVEERVAERRTRRLQDVALASRAADMSPPQGPARPVWPPCGTSVAARGPRERQRTTPQGTPLRLPRRDAGGPTGPVGVLPPGCSVGVAAGAPYTPVARASGAARPVAALCAGRGGVGLLARRDGGGADRAAADRGGRGGGRGGADGGRGAPGGGGAPGASGLSGAVAQRGWGDGPAPAPRMGRGQAVGEWRGRPAGARRHRGEGADRGARLLFAPDRCGARRALGLGGHASAGDGDGAAGGRGEGWSGLDSGLRGPPSAGCGAPLGLSPGPGRWGAGGPGGLWRGHGGLAAVGDQAAPGLATWPS
jgi:hypothetical protein